MEPKARIEKAIPRGTERVLFIDDEEVLADMGRQMLESLGYEVTTRTNSIEALALFKANPYRFDLVITDMTMPNLTGDELSKELIAARPDIPVILCTGFSTKVTAERATNLGIRKLALKPILKNDIAETIREILSKK